MRKLITLLIVVTLTASACNLGQVDPAEAGTTTTTTTTTTTVPDTTTSSTTAVLETTTSSTTTTLPPEPECVDSFYWIGLDDNGKPNKEGGTAVVGPLRGEQDNDFSDIWVTVAGCLLEIIRVDTVLAGEETTQVFLRFSFTEPGAEVEIVRDLYLGLIGGPEVDTVPWTHPRGWIVPVDPGADPEDTIVNGSLIPTSDFIDKLVIGRLYPVDLLINTEARPVPGSCEDRWFCHIYVESGRVDPYPRGHELHSDDSLDVGMQLYQTLLGNDVPEPEFGYGWVFEVYLVPVYEG